MTASFKITIRDVTHENWLETLALSVAPEQQKYVAGYAPIALVGLAKAYVRPLGWRWLPYAIYADDDMIGFFELAFDTGVANQCWLFHFFIDQQHQNKGYGKQAAKMIIHFVRDQFPSYRMICLTVHPDNDKAKHVYTHVGFTPTGEQAFDEPEYQLILS